MILSLLGFARKISTLRVFVPLRKQNDGKDWRKKFVFFLGTNIFTIIEILLIPSGNLKLRRTKILEKLIYFSYFSGIANT
jgi:hypothetical protein